MNADIRLVTPTFQAIVDALCALNGWGKHEIILGEKSKQLNKDQAERDVKLKDAGAVFTNQYFIREYGLQEGDLAESLPSQTPQPQFNALPKRPFSFAASVKKFSPEQLEVEELTDSQKDIVLLDQVQINELVQSTENVEELAVKLMQIMPNATESTFTANLDQALYAADVYGYVTAKGGK